MSWRKMPAGGGAGDDPRAEGGGAAGRAPGLRLQPGWGCRAHSKSGVAPGACAPRPPHQFQETRAGGAKCW